MRSESCARPSPITPLISPADARTANRQCATEGRPMSCRPVRDVELLSWLIQVLELQTATTPSFVGRKVFQNGEELTY